MWTYGRSAFKFTYKQSIEQWRDDTEIELYVSSVWNFFVFAGDEIAERGSDNEKEEDNAKKKEVNFPPN